MSIEEKFEQFVNEKYPYVIMDAFTAGYLEGKKELQKELDEAFEVIKFYACVSHYGNDTPSSNTSIDPCDHEVVIINTWSYQYTDIRGGKRARDFLKARGE